LSGGQEVPGSNPGAPTVRKVLEWLGFRRSDEPEVPAEPVPEPSPYTSQAEVDAEDQRRALLDEEERRQGESGSAPRDYDA
jgi:hypothetical protein